MLVIPSSAVIEPCSTTDFNVHYINKIAKLSKEARQESKAPTFRIDLPRNIFNLSN